MAARSLLRSHHWTNQVVPSGDDLARLCSLKPLPPLLVVKQRHAASSKNCTFHSRKREGVRPGTSFVSRWKCVGQSGLFKESLDFAGGIRKAAKTSAAFDGGPWFPGTSDKFRGRLSVAALNTVESESPSWLTVQDEEPPQGITVGSGDIGSGYPVSNFHYASESDDNSDAPSDGPKRSRVRLSERSSRYVENVPEDALERVRLKAEIHGEAIDEAEVLRRARIALSNEGKKPWNKGRPHSEETKRKIRERTMAAMKDPETIKRLERKHAEGWVARRHIRTPKNPGWYKDVLQQRRTQKLVEQQVLGLWRDANSQAARDSRDWLKRYAVIPERKPRAVPLVGRPRTAEHRARISESIRARWQEKKLRQSEALGNMKVLEARRRELAEEARALYKEAEAAAAALHAMPKSPAVLAALAETQRVLLEAAKKVEQASGSQKPPPLVPREPRQKTVTAGVGGGNGGNGIRRDASNQPPRLGVKPPPGLGSKPPGLGNKPPALGTKLSGLGGQITGSGADSAGLRPNLLGKDDSGSGSGLVMVEELEDLSNVAWGGEGHVAKPKLNGHRVKAAEALGETYGSMGLEYGGRDVSKPNENGVLQERGPPPGPFFRKETESSSGHQDATS